MKVVSILLFLVSGIQAQQVYHGSILLKTQSEVDSFKVKYPNVSKIDENLWIESEYKQPIFNLDSLHGIEEIGNKLVVQSNYSLSSISGLSSIKSVSELVFRNNDLIKSLDDFTKLEQIKTGIKISGNRRLKDLSNLRNMNYKSIEYFIFMGNDNVRSLSVSNSFEKLSEITITGNNKLKTVIGFSNIDSLNYVEISANNLLKEVLFLNKIREINQCRIAFNRTLNMVDMSNLEEVNHKISIIDNPNLMGVKFSNKLSLSPDCNVVIKSNEKLNVKDKTILCRLLSNSNKNIEIIENKTDCE